MDSPGYKNIDQDSTIINAVYLVGLECANNIPDNGATLAELDCEPSAEKDRQKLSRDIAVLGSVLSLVDGLGQEHSAGKPRKPIYQSNRSEEERDANYRRLADELLSSEPCTFDGLRSLSNVGARPDSSLSLSDIGARPDSSLSLSNSFATPEPRKRLKFMGILETPDRKDSNITDMLEDSQSLRGLDHKNGAEELLEVIGSDEGTDSDNEPPQNIPDEGHVPRKRLKFMGILGQPDRASSDITGITAMPDNLPDRRGMRERLKRLFRRYR